MSKELTVLPDTKELSEHRGQVQIIQENANTYTIRAPIDVGVGEQFLRDIKTAETSIVERKTEITRPLMQALASARDLFKPFETGLADAKKTVKEKILAYQVEQDEVRKTQEERILARVEKGTMTADTAAGKIEALVKSEVKTNTRILRKLRIMDETLLPREYLIPDREAITKALFAGKDVFGAILVEEKVLVTK